ncbi:MAG: LapA family protein [Mycobacteriaceae bacterium]|nr:LapA family protein [Mycobacteriaceae bacterium]
MTKPHDPVDAARTHQPRAGAAMKDTRGLPGFLLIGLAVLFLVICLAAAAIGNHGWTIGAGVVAIAAAALGSVWVFAQRRRIARGARRTPADSTRKGNAEI